MKTALLIILGLFIFFSIIFCLQAKKRSRKEWQIREKAYFDSIQKEAEYNKR